MSIVTQSGIWEHFGQNRSGKSLLMAVFAWLAYLAGMDVYANCPTDPKTGGLDHILNFAHYCINAADLFSLNLYGVFVLIDEGAQRLDSYRSTSTEVRDLGHWGYQVRKRKIIWHYDTVLHGNVEKRVRRNPDYYVETVRVPRDYHQPLQAVKIVFTENITGQETVRFLLEPWRFFPVYNHEAMVRPMEIPAQ